MEGKRTIISRRNFLAGAGLAAVGAAAAGITGCSPANGTEQKANAESAAAGNSGNTVGSGHWSWSVPPEPVADADVSETVDCEILVIGLGSAGLTATVYAAAMGADVVTFNAASTAEAEGAYCGAYNTKYDEENGIVYDAAALRKDYAVQGAGSNNGEVTGTIWDRSGNAIDWFAEYCKDVWAYECGPDSVIDEGIHEREHATHMVYVWPDPEETQEQKRVYNGFTKFVQVAADKAESDGARIYYSTPAQQLIVNDDGSIAGAYGLKSDGTYVKANASKGVLMATGDFHHNDEMIEAFLPIMKGDLQTRNPYNTAQGDGLKMAMWAGIPLETGPYCIGLCWPHDFTFDEYSPSKWGLIPFLRVNIAGVRYTNENLDDEWYSTSILCLADVKQPDHTGYQICDSKYGELVDAELFEECVEKGVIFKADSLEELAEKVGFLDTAQFVETVERYNENCKNGYDADFGVESEFLAHTSITEPPFYCMKRPVLKQWANGGLQTNKFGQVLNAEWKPAGGLYAAGNVRAGLCGTHYLWKSFGSNKLNAMTGGMLAVKHMLGTWDEEF